MLVHNGIVKTASRTSLPLIQSGVGGFLFRQGAELATLTHQLPSLRSLPSRTYSPESPNHRNSSTANLYTPRVRDV